LYPANPCNTGSPLYSGQEWYFGTWLFARFRGLYARDPLRGLDFDGMYQSILSIDLSGKGTCTAGEPFT
jgi:hypothetical protein